MKERFQLSKFQIYLGWGISLCWGIIYLLVFTQYFGNGELYGDTRNFIHDGQVLSELASSDPLQFIQLLAGFDSNNLELLNNELAETNIWSYGDNGDFINDNRLIIKINALINLISAGNLWTHSVFFSALSFAGTLLLFKAFERFTSRPTLLYYGLLVVPTISFWGGGITKECILLFSVGLFFYAGFKLLKDIHWKTVTLFLIAIGLLAFNKPHVGIALFFFSWIFVFLRAPHFRKRQLFIAGLISVVLAVILSFTPNRINLVDRISFKQKDLINLGEGGVFFINDSAFCAFDYKDNANFTYYESTNRIIAHTATEGSYKLFGDTLFQQFTIQPSLKQYEVYHIIPPSTSIIEVNRVDYSGTQLIKNIPQAFQNVLLRPYPWDPGDPSKILSFIENILLLGFFIWVFINRKPGFSQKQKITLTYLLFVSLVLLLIIGWTTPILGAIVRYKMAPILLLFIGACLAVSSKQTKHEEP